MVNPSRYINKLVEIIVRSKHADPSELMRIAGTLVKVADEVCYIKDAVFANAGDIGHDDEEHKELQICVEDILIVCISNAAKVKK